MSASSFILRAWSHGNLKDVFSKPGLGIDRKINRSQRVRTGSGIHEFVRLLRQIDPTGRTLVHSSLQIDQLLEHATAGRTPAAANAVSVAAAVYVAALYTWCPQTSPRSSHGRYQSDCRQNLGLCRVHHRGWHHSCNRHHCR